MIKEIEKNGQIYLIEENYYNHCFYQKFNVYKIQDKKILFYKKFIAIDLKDVIEKL